jgi:hypothetical protein
MTGQLSNCHAKPESLEITYFSEGTPTRRVPGREENVKNLADFSSLDTLEMAGQGR